MILPKRRGNRFAIGGPLLRGLSLGLALSAVHAPTAAPDANEHRTQLDSVRSRIDGLRAQMQSTSGKKSALVSELQTAEREIGRLARRLRQLDGRLERAQQRLARLHVQRGEQAGELDRQRRALVRQVRAAYVMGRQERLKILLNQQDPATVSRVMAYYDYLGRARARKMREIRDQLARLAETEREIRSDERRLAELRDEQAGELDELQRSQARRRDVVARLARELQDQGRRLDRLQTDERELAALIRGIEQALADIPLDGQQVAFAGLRGRLPWPAKGRIVERFGAPRLGSLVWDGVMISAPEGREVRAVHHGRVAFADWLRGFGLLLIVDHGDGYMTLYGHNQSLFKEVGDWVDVEEPVALVGSSGGRERAGVYFAIRRDGKAVDPAKWCRRGRGRNVG